MGSNASGRSIVSRYFFLFSAIAMLVVVALGFTRTFFFRAYFDVPVIPSYLYVHGLLVTTWFAWFVSQCSLIVTHRRSLHQRLGKIGIGLAVGVVAINTIVMLNLVPRRVASGASIETDFASLADTVFFNLLILVSFLAFLTLAVVYRRRPEIHKRLMYFASFSMLGPAVSRVPASLAEFGFQGGVLVPVIFLSFVAAPLVFDLVTRRRPHVVTVVGLVSFFVPGFLIPRLATSDMGRSLVEWLA